MISPDLKDNHERTERQTNSQEQLVSEESWKSLGGRLGSPGGLLVSGGPLMGEFLNEFLGEFLGEFSDGFFFSPVCCRHLSDDSGRKTQVNSEVKVL